MEVLEEHPIAGQVEDPEEDPTVAVLAGDQAGHSIAEGDPVGNGQEEARLEEVPIDREEVAASYQEVDLEADPIAAADVAAVDIRNHPEVALGRKDCEVADRTTFGGIRCVSIANLLF